MSNGAEVGISLISALFLYSSKKVGGNVSVTVSSVASGSPADKKIKNGDKILTINGSDIMDVLDYRFYQNDKRLTIGVETADGKLKKVRIRKGEYDELGLEFESYLMDKEHSCRNKCIFCFIDQMPKGMRSSLYFKDDDSRLSFLFGNYITLTNLSEHEISRIIKMHISPVNISVHTTNKQLRCEMMNNRFAGEALDVLKRFNDANIKMNCQLVLCPDYNDGKELERSLEDLLNYENVLSIAAVPVGLTKYRDGLTELKPFDKQRAGETLDILNKYGEQSLARYGERKVYGSDEFYLLSEREIPDADFYEDFAQLDNGVGTWSLLLKEASEEIESSQSSCNATKQTIVTGMLAKPLLEQIVNIAKQKWPNLNCEVVAIRNDFFGERITVAGLVTGKDIINQLKNKDLGENILIPECMLRFENDLFLDDVSVKDVEEALGVKVITVKNEGFDLIDKIIQ